MQKKKNQQNNRATTSLEVWVQKEFVCGTFETVQAFETKQTSYAQSPFPNHLNALAYGANHSWSKAFISIEQSKAKEDEELSITRKDKALVAEMKKGAKKYEKEWIWQAQRMKEIKGRQSGKDALDFLCMISYKHEKIPDETSIIAWEQIKNKRMYFKIWH